MWWAKLNVCLPPSAIYVMLIRFNLKSIRESLKAFRGFHSGHRIFAVIQLRLEFKWCKVNCIHSNTLNRYEDAKRANTKQKVMNISAFARVSGERQTFAWLHSSTLVNKVCKQQLKRAICISLMQCHSMYTQLV